MGVFSRFGSPRRPQRALLKNSQPSWVSEKRADDFGFGRRSTVFIHGLERLLFVAVNGEVLSQVKKALDRHGIFIEGIGLLWHSLLNLTHELAVATSC